MNVISSSLTREDLDSQSELGMRETSLHLLIIVPLTLTLTLSHFGERTRNNVNKFK